MIELRGVGRSFGATEVLRDIDLDVGAGERVVVVGDNGSGKTTLVRILARLLAPTQGSAVLPPAAGIGLLTHTPSLYGRLTALENLRFWAGMYGRRARPELLERVGLDPGDRRPVSAYSQGMRQRAGLARALVHEPSLLLLDEPFAGLDGHGRAAAAALVAEPGRTVVMTSHGDAPHGYRVLRLAGGRLS